MHQNKVSSYFKRGPIDLETNRNNTHKNYSVKVYWIRHAFEVEHKSLYTKKQKKLSLRDHQVPENMVLFLIQMKRRKSYHNIQFSVTRFIGNRVTIIFISKCSSNS